MEISIGYVREKESTGTLCSLRNFHAKVDYDFLPSNELMSLNADLNRFRKFSPPSGKQLEVIVSLLTTYSIAKKSERSF